MDNNKIRVDFRLIGIKTEQFAMLKDNFIANIDSDLEVKLQFKIDGASKQVGTYIDFEFSQKNKVFLKLEISCHFELTNDSLQHFYDTETNKITLPKSLLSHLGIITTGTARGVLFAKTENTEFSNYIIPTLNINEMIPEKVVFDLN